MVTGRSLVTITTKLTHFGYKGESHNTVVCRQLLGRRRIPPFPVTSIRRNMNYLVPPPSIPSVPVLTETTDASLVKSVFPVRRIYCVGKNYAEHVAEMGGDASKEAPVFFCKPASAILHCPDGGNVSMQYPLQTQNLHHEVEFVLAIGKECTNVPVEAALDHVVAFGVGLDMTRRDRQAEAKKAGGPWDVAKALDDGAPIATLTTVPPANDAAIQCRVNGAIRQNGRLDQMIWPPAAVIHHLSARFTLCPGDLIYTGTPSGVGPLRVGDAVTASIDGLPTLQLSIVERKD